MRGVAERAASLMSGRGQRESTGGRKAHTPLLDGVKAMGIALAATVAAGGLAAPKTAAAQDERLSWTIEVPKDGQCVMRVNELPGLGAVVLTGGVYPSTTVVAPSGTRLVFKGTGEGKSFDFASPASFKPSTDELADARAMADYAEETCDSALGAPKR